MEDDDSSTMNGRHDSVRASASDDASEHALSES